MDFKLHAPYQPTGDQPQAIEALTRGVELGFHEQVMLGVTGSGKTFTMANVIARLNRPTLVLAHKKTLSPTTTTTSPRPIFPTPTPILKRTPPPTTRSTACG